MAKQRMRYTSEFKALVAMEADQGATLHTGA